MLVKGSRHLNSQINTVIIRDDRSRVPPAGPVHCGTAASSGAVFGIFTAS